MKNIVKVIVYVFLLIIGIYYLSIVYEMKNGESVIINKKVKNIDVFFVGSSGILRGISPMELYNNYGVTSYNIGGSWAQIPLDYYLIKENSKNYKPKIIVLDMESFFEKKIETYDNLHYAIDKLPLNDNKIEFVNSKIWNMSMSDKISFLFPIFRFHDKWGQLSIGNYILKNNSVSSCTKDNCYGYLNHTDVYIDPDINYMSNKTDETNDDYINNYSAEYILKIKDYCDKKNIELVLLMPPHQLWSNTKYEKVNNWSKKNNLVYIDSNYKNVLNLNIKNDFADKNHLNISGATKFSNYLGEFLTKKYDFIDHRNDDTYSEWNNDAKKYENFKKDFLNSYNNSLKRVESRRKN